MTAHLDRPAFISSGARRSVHGGRVSLVGAGPGDPGLLTLRALERLQTADVVLFDRLVGEGVLELVGDHSELISVGKTPHRPSTPQAQIHRLMIEHARAGKHVVRLKGGDPYVFGRGAEERLALEQAGIVVEVVPGISSALAGPSSAGIPLTLRNVATSFAVVTGHRSSSEVPEPDWTALASIDTLVILMGISRASEIAQRLIDAGRSSSVPVAVVENASLSSQRVVRTTLASLTRTIETNAIRPPSIIVVGETAHGDLGGVLGAAESTYELPLASREVQHRLGGTTAAAAPELVYAMRRDDRVSNERDRDFDFLTVDLLGLLESAWRALLGRKPLGRKRAPGLEKSSVERSIRQKTVHPKTLRPEGLGHGSFGDSKA